MRRRRKHETASCFVNTARRSRRSSTVPAPPCWSIPRLGYDSFSRENRNECSSRTPREPCDDERRSRSGLCRGPMLHTDGRTAAARRGEPSGAARSCRAADPRPQAESRARGRVPAHRGVRNEAPAAGTGGRRSAGGRVSAALVAVPVFTEAWASLRHPNLHGITDRLVALALIAAWATGDLFTAALLPIVMTIGHVLEERSMLGSHEAVRALTRLTEVDSRRILPDGSVELAPSAQLRSGDLIELRPGERIPADGTVRRGESNVDLASLTGESVPVEVGEGHP